MATLFVQYVLGNTDEHHHESVDRLKECGNALLTDDDKLENPAIENLWIVDGIETYTYVAGDGWDYSVEQF